MKICDFSFSSIGIQIYTESRSRPGEMSEMDVEITHRLRIKAYKLLPKVINPVTLVRVDRKIFHGLAVEQFSYTWDK